MIALPTKPFIHKRLLGPRARQALDLRECWLQGHSIIGIVVLSIGPDNPVVSRRSDNPYFAAKLVALVGFAFSEALHLWSVYAIYLAMIRALLRINPLGNIHYLFLFC